ncbi:hypothetical protein [Streptomyces sp. NPDC003719]
MIVIGVSAVLTPDHVSACAEALGAVAATTMVRRSAKDDGLLTG